MTNTKPIHHFTLSDLKKDPQRFIWNLCQHTYLKEAKPGFMGPREVKRVQTNGIQFNNDSWLY